LRRNQVEPAGLRALWRRELCRIEVVLHCYAATFSVEAS
jgi:hypothetical protein